MSGPTTHRPYRENIIDTSILLARTWPLPTAAPDSAEIMACLARLLASHLFCKARRLSQLLQFLVEKRLTGSQRDTTEYGIGIDVFDRDPAAYSTGEDPIVRVQVGRLRAKLRLYYAEAGRADDVVIAIPVGSYMPVIKRIDAPVGERCAGPLLAVRPLQNASGDAGGALFAQGLSEELSFQLFKTFGERVVSYTFPGSGAGASHLLEGSVRIDGELIRTAVRLVDAGSGAIVWSEQRDRHGSPGILVQEGLAQAICAGLAGHLPLQDAYSAVTDLTRSPSSL